MAHKKRRAGRKKLQARRKVRRARGRNELLSVLRDSGTIEEATSVGQGGAVGVVTLNGRVVYATKAGSPGKAAAARSRWLNRLYKQRARLGLG